MKANNMSDIKTLIKEIKDNNKIANLVLEGTDYRTIGSRTMLKNQAVLRSVELKNKYKEMLHKSIFVIEPQGPHIAEFVELANKNELIVVDAGELYVFAAEAAAQTMGHKQQFDLEQYAIVDNILKRWCEENDVEFHFEILPSETTVCKTTQDVLICVKKHINTYNAHVNKAYIEERISKIALDREIDTKVIPVVVLNCDGDFGLKIFSGKRILVDTNQDINQQLVTKTFEQIKKLLKEK